MRRETTRTKARWEPGFKVLGDPGLKAPMRAARAGMSVEESREGAGRVAQRLARCARAPSIGPLSRRRAETRLVTSYRSVACLKDRVTGNAARHSPLMTQNAT